MRKLDDRKRKWIIWILFVSLLVTSCGKQTNRGAEAEIETKIETETERNKKAEVKLERADGIPDYMAEESACLDEEIPTVYTDDLSLLDHMEQTDCSYAYRDGKVYYRQYHRDSFEEAALYADYKPIADTDKEIVCIDADGEKTVLFSDKGYGNIYLIGNRFYMTEMVIRVMDDKDYTYPNIYSVDMQGQNRIDYGYGEIYASDMDRKVLILNMWSEKIGRKYYALDCMSDEMISLTVDSCDSQTFWDYYDGWCYFDAHQNTSEDTCQVVAVSLEGEQKELIELKSDNETADEYGYREDICEMGIAGDRVYIVYGGYDGTARCFQGGNIITIKLDGSDYRETWSFADAYYVCCDAGRTLVYIPHSWAAGEKKYDTTVWDVEANTTFPSSFPWQLIYSQQTHSVLPYKEHIAPEPLCVLRDEGINVCALPDHSGRIVRVAMQIDDDIAHRGGEEVDYISYQHLYYADGYLYFDVSFNIYDVGCSIGWRDGYRRLQTDVYRLKLDENAMELLYSY
ncbi:MAG: hypothetical protein HDQ97_17960 [Lachnospiraceae bacterium]|nr:hypothetical protein [Lachnospiraceae bacterium]